MVFKRAPLAATLTAAGVALSGCSMASGELIMDEKGNVLAARENYPGALRNYTTASITSSKPALTPAPKPKPASDRTR